MNSAADDRKAAETMFSVRFHGRGGQGVVTAAELLASAAFSEGRHAQAFPSFGSERMGAPVMSFCRIDDRPIRTHEPVTEPDALIVQDPTLLHQPGLLDGLRPDGYLLVNSPGIITKLAVSPGHLIVVPGTALAMAHLGRPLPGAVMLGGFAALTGVVTLDSVLAAIAERFAGQVAAGNAAAARDAYEYVTDQKKALTDA